MKEAMNIRDHLVTAAHVSALLMFFLFGAALQTPCQSGRNTISGHVFNLDRRPVSDVFVELLDDLSRTIGRMRTNASGLYTFQGVPPGRFKVRVLPLGTDYEDQEQEVEIINFERSAPGGGTRLSGFANEVRDFYLRQRRTGALGTTGSVFIQDVPAEAKKKFDDGVENLNNKKTKEAYESLKSALEIFPKYFAALELLGTEYLKAGHYEAAQILLTIAVEVNARGDKSWHGLALAYYSQNKHPEALAAVEKALSINPSSAQSLLLSGTILRQDKQYAEAEKRLLKAKELSPSSAIEAHWELALLYANGLKRYKDAAKELRLYLRARPDHKDAENIKKLIAEFERKGNAS